MKMIRSSTGDARDPSSRVHLICTMTASRFAVLLENSRCLDLYLHLIC